MTGVTRIAAAFLLALAGAIVIWSASALARGGRIVESLDEVTVRRFPGA